MSIVKNVGTLFIVAVTLSACAHAAPEVAGMPSNNEWNNTLMTSTPAYIIAGCAGGCMPTDAVWNAVLAEDRKEMHEGMASQRQLNIDVQIGRLLPQAREAIAANDISKIGNIGAKLEADLNVRMQIIAEIANTYAREHPHPLGLPASVGSEPLGGYGAAGGSYAPEPGVNCVVEQGQGWSGCAPN